ncbi:hypothetical protein PIROE2DRAFT_5365 [Piromyces sp. E2]|nr:hypothetical protein PIROE2DRAFT_5365 [Piromyces sp. E2]|eukprot:OUM67211.1 hypothetical protein PIROE2DRAFT_5365 [Piromyces sp. E2]
MGNVGSYIDENINNISDNVSNFGLTNNNNGNLPTDAANGYYNNGNSNYVDSSQNGNYNFNSGNTNNNNDLNNTGMNNLGNSSNNNVEVDTQTTASNPSDTQYNQLSSNQNSGNNNYSTNSFNENPQINQATPTSLTTTTPLATQAPLATPAYIPQSNTITTSPETQNSNDNNASQSSNIFDWMKTTVFSIKGFNVTYLYIVIASASAVLLFSLLLLTCIIVRRKKKNKRKRMKLIDISNSSNLRNMLDETTSQVGYDNDYRRHDDPSEENIALENNNKNNNYLEYNDYPDYKDYQDYFEYPEDPKPYPVTQHYQTLPNPKAAYPTGKSIDYFQPNYTRMSTPVFPTSTSTSPNQLYRKSSIVSTKYDCEFDSGYNFYSQNMKLNKSMLKSNSIKSKKYKKSPISNFIDLNNNEYNNVEDSPKSKTSQPTDILDDQNNYNSSNVKNKNTTTIKTYLKSGMNNNNNNNYNNNYNNNNNNYNYNNNSNNNNNNNKNYSSNDKNNNLYPQEGELDNAYRNLFAEGKYKTMPQSNYQMKFKNNGDGMKRKPMSCITPKDNYQSNQGYPLDFLYRQPQQLNTLSPIKNSLPNYMSYDNLNTVDKMVSPTNRLNSAPVSSNNPFLNNDNIVYPPITMLNDEELINEQSRYPVDQDYMAIYSYQPVVNDELFITINDRIHLLQTYSDGWAYGKNVTTGRLGVFPLNRLSSVKKKRIESVKSDKESERTKVNINSNNNEISSPSNKKNLTYSLSKLQHKNASQETLINRKSSFTNSNMDSPTTGSSTYLSPSPSYKIRPKKSRTLIIKNFSDEDLRDKSQSTVLSNTEEKIDISDIEKKKGKHFSSNSHDGGEKLKFSNLRQSYTNAKDVSREERKKESDDDDLELDSFLRLKIDFDDFISGRPLSRKQNKTNTNTNNTTTTNYFSDISVPY